MTTETANFYFDMDNQMLKAMLVEYRKSQPPKSKHIPSVRAVKAIAPYLGHRQRSRPKYGGIAVDDSLRQIHEKTGYSVSTISDVIKFLEYFGFIETLRHGGGRNKQPTVRRLITQYPNNELSGILFNLNDYFLDLHGKKHDLNGVFPETPRELPRFIPRVCTSKDSKFIFEEPFLEENFIDEEYGFTPEDVTVLLNENGELPVMEPF
jgi:hypothetical protein